MTRIAPLLGLLLLAGCATTPPPEVPKPAPPPPPPAGMEPILHHPAETALQLLGPARLDKREGAARQLQFAGGCILDIWYYPEAGTAPGAIPVATHADARLPDGRDIAAGECLHRLIAAREAQAAAARPPEPPHTTAKPAAKPAPVRKKR